MDARLKEEKVMDERLKIMPFVRGDYGKATPFAIMRVCERRCKSLGAIKSVIWHLTRKSITPNADPERLENNEQVYGAKDLYEDCVNYLEDAKLSKNSVLAREMLLTASPQFFIGMTKQDFEKWIDVNIKWCKETFGESFRAAYLHLDENSPHCHILILPKLWNEKKNCYTMQNYRYFNGYRALRDLQDSYYEAVSKDFLAIARGIRFSRSKHQRMQKLYGIMDNTEKQSLETLQAKAANQELLKIRNNHMEKTLKSYQNSNRRKDEEILKKDNEIKTLLEQLQELKNKGQYKDLKETLEATTEKKKGISRNFSGKRYNKSV